ncbi:MAG TPA: S9 family peptidase, partial [Symbiobacteriaceae bacterium]|nr:S9 family peptidase [Symbiobacteriaceae bacterium]
LLHLPGLETSCKRTPGPWAADDSGFYFTADEGREFSGLFFYDRVTGTAVPVAEPDWDVTEPTGDREGRRLLYSVNEDGFTRPYLQDLTSGDMIALPPALGEGVIATYAISPDGNKLACRMSAANLAPECYVHDLVAGTTTRLTYSLLGGIDEADLRVPELVRFPTFDGRLIPGWLYKPRDLAAGARIPAVLVLHGGPEGQEQPDYGPQYQYLLDQGIAVLAPNIRGSTGYGKTYQRLILRDWGGGDLKDLEACAQYLRSLPWVDPERIAVMGGSYGGFATLQAVTRLPEYWACGVDFCGPSNLVTLTRSVPPTWRAMLKDWVGDPEEDREMLVERSPITYVDNVRCPLLVLQGAMDPRVVKAESDQMVERLRDRGIPVEYLVFEDEGHGLTKRHNLLAGTRAMSGYLVKHLKPQA